MLSYRSPSIIMVAVVAPIFVVLGEPILAFFV